MATITIGNLTLDDSYSTFTNISFEYFTTPTGEIIGGSKVFTISGSVSVQSGQNSGSNVMKQLKGIRDIGKNTKCVQVNIPGLYSGMAKITNITIDQGSDPTWVNQAPFSIELKAQLDSIPPNSLGITVEDYVVEVSRSETIELGEESHGFVFTSDNRLSKAFAKFSCEASVSCRPLCANITPQDAALKVLKKIIKTSPDHPEFAKYQGWNIYSQSRNLESNGPGSLSFSTDIILLHPSVTGGAFVELDFHHAKGYSDKTESKKVSGTVTGLAKIAWSDVIDLPDSASASKFSQAANVFSYIKSKYNTLKTWRGIELELKEKPNCPPENTGAGSQGPNLSIGKCTDKSNPGEEDEFEPLRPASSTVSSSRSEGTISFDFEWNNSSNDSGNCVDDDGFTREVVVEVTEPQPQIIEHIIPSVGTLIQDLNCCSAKRISFTSSIGNPDGACSSSGLPVKEAYDQLDKEIVKYLTGAYWLLVSHTKQTTNTNVTIFQEYIERC